MGGHWTLPFEVSRDLVERAANIRLAMFDVDGVLTDGGVYINDQGDETKRFHIHDGHGLKLLKNAGVETGIVTARRSRAVKHRADELGIAHVYTECRDKVAVGEKLCSDLGISLTECCYTGDDLVDIPLFLRCGLAVAVGDAHHVAKRAAHWVTPSAGGQGAAREVCDLILYAQAKFDAVMGQYFDRKVQLNA